MNDVMMWVMMIIMMIALFHIERSRGASLFYHPCLAIPRYLGPLGNKNLEREHICTIIPKIKSYTVALRHSLM